MESKQSFKVFRFENDARWTTGRECVICKPGKPDLQISSPPEFKGNPAFWTPEDMFVASVNVCILMTFTAYAHHKGLGLIGYESSAEGVLEYSDGKYRFTEVTLHPHITLKSQEEAVRAREILEDAHKNCLISNSIVAQVKIFPDFHAAEPSS